jgi:hypothetical protein
MQFQSVDLHTVADFLEDMTIRQSVDDGARITHHGTHELYGDCMVISDCGGGQAIITF